MSGQGTKFGDFLTGLLIGGVVGYVVALLNAPATGDETRQMLTQRSQEIRDRAMDSVQTTLDKTGKLVSDSRDRISSTVEDTRNRAQDRVSDLKDRSTNAVTDVRGQVSDKLHQVADSVDPNTTPGTSSGSEPNPQI